MTLFRRPFDRAPRLRSWLALAVFAPLLLSAPHPAEAQEFVANQIENLISSDTARVDIEGLSGALTGAVRIDRLTVSDADGVYLTASDLAMDWSPLALVRKNVSIESLTAGRIVLDRLPRSAAPAADDSGGGFSLPSITADIRSIAINEFELGQAVAGTPARLKATASLGLAADPTRLDVRANIDRLDKPGTIAATIAFAPAEDRLTIDVAASEPAGGLVAGLLQLPGAPPVNLTVKGNGPLSDFMANGALTVGGEQAASVTARVNALPEGRRVSASLSVAAERFAPDSVRAYVSGATTLDAQLLFRPDGLIGIDQADLASDALALTARGTLDQTGTGNDLSFSVSSRQGAVIPFAFGTEPNQTKLEVASLSGTLKGALSASDLTLKADLPTAGFGQYIAQRVTASATGNGFNVTALTGPFAIEAAAQSVASPEGLADRFLEGPVAITAAGSLGDTGLTLTESKATTKVAEASVAGTAALNFSAFDLSLSTAFDTSALSAAMIPLAGDRLAISGKVARTAAGALSAAELAVKGTGLSITGQAGLDAGTVSADIKGTIAQAEAVNAALGGEAQFSLTASGPVEKPDVDIALNSNGLTIGGRKLSDLKIEARGSFNPTAPSGTVRVAGNLDGAPITGTADVETLPSGERRIRNLAIKQGPNSITGELQITDSAAPVGTLTVAVEDIGPLAALAMQEAGGDLNGTVKLGLSDQDQPLATLDLVSRQLTVGGNTLRGADIKLSAEDYLGQPFPQGRVTAEGIDAGGVAVRDLSIALDRKGELTTLATTATANSVPVEVAGSVRFDADATIVSADRLTADIEGAAVALANPTALTIVNGGTRFEALTLNVGSGSLVLNGTAGETLDLTARLNAVPAAVANPFVPDLAASGTLSGEASAKGPAGDPTATFAITGTDIATSQTRAAKLPPLTPRIAGDYAKGTLNLHEAAVGLGEGAVSASGQVGEQLNLRIAADKVPVALANGFVDRLDASGTVSGTATATGTLQRPNASFDLTGTGITATAVAAAGVPPMELALSGSYADEVATLTAARATLGAALLEASGTVGRTVDLKLAMRDLPAALANAYLPDLKAAGTISGTATASGPIDNPAAVFDITGNGLTAAESRASGVPPLDLRLAGRYADETADIETAVANVGAGSLNASGRVGRNLDLTVGLNALPVGLVNGFVPGLKASGTVSGNGKATGSIADPTADFALTGTGLTTEAIARSGIKPVELDLSGRYAAGTATIASAKATVGDGNLMASGTVGRTLDLSVRLADIPVGLVNGFVSGLDATGTISGDATATGSIDAPQARFALTGTGITAATVKAGKVPPISLDVAGTYAGDSATIERARATVGSGSLSARGTVGQTLDLDVTLDAVPVSLANGFVPGLGASGTVSGSAKASGPVADPTAEFTLAGRSITATQIARSKIEPLRLDVTGSYAAGTATLKTARAVIGNGSLTATGTVGQRLDIDVELTRVPVGIANGFVPNLGAAGTISGTASATGSISDPAASFDLSASGISTAQTRAAKAPSVNAVAKGRYARSAVTIETARVDVGGGSIVATGSAGQTLDLSIDLNRVPASLLSAAASGIDPSGTINGNARVTGSASNPSVDYNLDIAGLTLAQTREAGVGPLGVGARGRFANNVATVDARLSGSAIAFTVSGSVNVAGTPQLDLALNGTAPLALANRILAEGGRSVQGTVRVDARVSGPASQPNVVGTVSTSGAQFVDTGLNLAIRNINTQIALNGQTATIQSFSASLSSGGTIAVSGSVGLNNGFPADIRVRVVDGRYNDGELIGATLNADLSLTGPLTGAAVLSGTINAEEINIIVPENLPTSLARIDVKHKNAPRAVYKQQEEIAPKGAGTTRSGGGIQLDLTFNAPNRVFVRGRGLDIELGGSIRLTGSASSPSIVGGFDLQRGRFRILGKRLDFERGRLSFTGDLVPTLDLLATSDTGDATVNIAVTGPANMPDFNFSSTPALPQDEVLARLIFNQGTADLSPLQIAQLAEAAATLAGVGGSTGLLDNLRSQIGVDDLDIKTTSDGQTAVGVGKYLNDNTYLGVDSTGRVSIDLNLGEGLKARGAVTATGGGEVGVFYEKEY
ncbi:translocation/assembly module TamB domain-containing protein [Mangrovicella endophytica]|uniref:translocation/assembly module TamB domain-containing protein n=1 Tax=Mangrovicella endophytica TaxID=2066697 RepID=UPI000C9DA9E7|nr:translocation/assembly module TamB domain-containing protein [Mangrovicella endophytica]